MVASNAARQHAPLVRAAAAGDDTAFRRLHDEYARTVYNMILRSVRDAQLAEDLAQEVWLKAHRQLGKLRDPEAFQAWLYRIATKACIDAARSRARHVDGAPIEDALPAVNSDPETRTIARDEAKRVWEALAALPAHQHLALFLREVEHMPYQEIAQILGVSQTAAGLCIYRGRRSFAAAYERTHDLDARGRCQNMHRVMSLSIDGQSTPVQDSVLRAHLKECASCRAEMEAMRTASQRYAGIALVPAPLMASDVLLASSLPAQSGLVPLLAKLLAPVAAPAKVSMVTASVIAGAVVAPQAVTMAYEAASEVVPGISRDAHAPSSDTDAFSSQGGDKSLERETGDADGGDGSDPPRAGDSAKTDDRETEPSGHPNLEIPADLNEALKPTEHVDETLDNAAEDLTQLLPELGLPLPHELLPELPIELELPIEVELPIELELPLEVELPVDLEAPLEVEVPPITELPLDDLVPETELPVEELPAPEDLLPTVEAELPLPLPTALPTLPPLFP